MVPSKVDFPEPDGPSNAKNSPGATDMLVGCNAMTAP
jgi:hypothetical protein